MALNTKPLNRQVALVTGGATGIGYAFAEALAHAGALVLIASRREEKLRQSADKINAKTQSDRVFPYAFDIRVFNLCPGLVDVDNMDDTLEPRGRDPRPQHGAHTPVRALFRPRCGARRYKYLCQRLEAGGQRSVKEND